jgi:hypothetical protein
MLPYYAQFKRQFSYFLRGVQREYHVGCAAATLFALQLAVCEKKILFAVLALIFHRVIKLRGGQTEALGESNLKKCSLTQRTPQDQSGIYAVCACVQTLYAHNNLCSAGDRVESVREGVEKPNRKNVIRARIHFQVGGAFDVPSSSAPLSLHLCATPNCSCASNHQTTK